MCKLFLVVKYFRVLDHFVFDALSLVDISQLGSRDTYHGVLLVEMQGPRLQAHAHLFLHHFFTRQVVDMFSR